MGTSLWMEFQQIAIQMVSVTCCRVSPDVKAKVTAGIKNNEPSKPTTLSIGDGANDVPMIQAAHVGIGISGVEGVQAVQASDYAIGQFRFLAKLLLVHGRWSYLRNTFVVCYSLYKNFAFTPAQYWWAFSTASSGQKFYIEWGYQCFNVAFAALPIFAYGIWEQDVSAKLSMANPELYKVGRRNELFTLSVVWQWLVQGLLQSAVIYFICHFALDLAAFPSGHSADGLWMFGTTVFGACVVNLNLRIAFEVRYWVWQQHLAIWGSILAFWMFLAAASGFDEYPASYVGNHGMVHQMYSSLLVWITQFLAVGAAIMPAVAVMCIKEHTTLAYRIRCQEHAAGRTPGFLACGFCGIPCGQNPVCCGDGCVNRSKCAEEGKV